MDYKELIEKDAKAAIETLTSQQKLRGPVSENYREFELMDRNIRDTQIGRTQVDKPIKGGKISKAVRLAVNFQKEIVGKSVAFDVGNSPTIAPTIVSELSDYVLKICKNIRLSSLLVSLLTIQKSQTESAVLFNIHTQGDGSRTIKARILEHKNGTMSPYFNAFNDMEAFVWQFVTKVDAKAVNNTWVFDNLNLYKISDASGSLILDEQIPHGFTKIPVVYCQQESCEWQDVKPLIDRYETTLSRLVETNDYSGHPLLAVYGTPISMPDKDDTGKTLNFPISISDDGTVIKGDAKFIENSGATNSVKLELDSTNSLIYSTTQTTNLSFDNLKGIGATSGTAMGFMFMDATLKSKNNQGENRKIIERILNIISDGAANTITVALKSQVPVLDWNITFNSILPADKTSLINDLVKGVQAGFISTQTAVKLLGIAPDIDLELELISVIDSTNAGQDSGLPQ